MPVFNCVSAVITFGAALWRVAIQNAYVICRNEHP